MADERILQVILKARDEASAKIEEVGDKITKTGSLVEKMASKFRIAGGVMIGAGVAGGAMMLDWVNKAADAQTEMARVDAILENTAKTINDQAMSYDKLKQITSEVSDAYIKLGFDDETTAGVFAKNLSITKDTAEAQKLLGLQADLARDRGIGLAEAGKAVTMAMMGSARILKTYGIELEDGATKEQIFAALQEKIGGSAEKASGTYKVAMERMGVQITNVKEKLGERLIPTITTFVDKISTVVDRLNKMDPRMFDTVVKVTALATAFLLVGGPILMIIGFLPMLAAGFGILFTTVLPIVAIIAGLAAVAFLLYKAWTENWGGIQEKVQSVISFLSTLPETVSSIINQVILWFQQLPMNLSIIVENIILWFQQLPDRIWLFLYDLFFIKIPFVIGFIAGWLSLQIPLLIGNIITWFSELPGKVYEIFQSVYNWISDRIMAAWNWLSTELPTWPGKIYDFIKSIPEKVKQVFEEAKKWAIDKMTELYNGVKSIWEKVVGLFNSIREAAERAWEAAKKGFEAGKGIIGSRQFGGPIFETGPYLLHRGEFVMSRDMLAGRQPAPAYATTNYNSPITINVASVRGMEDIDSIAHRLDFYLRTSGRI